MNKMHEMYDDMYMAIEEWYATEATANWLYEQYSEIDGLQQVDYIDYLKLLTKDELWA